MNAFSDFSLTQRQCQNSATKSTHFSLPSPRIGLENRWLTFGNTVSSSELNKKAYVHIEDWRNRPLQDGHYPYVYVDGIYLRRNWGGEYENV